MPSRSLPRLPTWLGYGAAALVFAAGCWLHWPALLNHDIAWLMIAAGRMLEGGSYLRDFFEVNQPLAIAVYIPPYALMHGLGLSWQAALTIYAGTLALQSSWLAARCLCRGAPPGLPAPFEPWLFCGFLAGLLFIPGYDFGQKEFLVVTLGLPYVCALAGSDGGAGLGRPLRLYLSLLAALGFFLKPHYAPLPFLLLMLQALRQRAWMPLWSLEAKTLLLAGAGYAGVVLRCYPDWLLCARWASDLYGAYRDAQLNRLLHVDGLPVAMVCTAIELILYWRVPALRRLLETLLCSALYAWGAYFIQYRGWGYQFLPTLLFTGAGLPLILAASLRGTPPRDSSRMAATAAALGVIAMVVAAAGAVRRMPQADALEGLPQVLAAARRGDAVSVLSFEVEPFLPAVPLAGLNWASRYSHLWPLLRLAAAETGSGAADREWLERSYRGPLITAIVEDFRHWRPQLVIVDRRPVQALPADYDIAAGLAASPDFAAVWKDYEQVGTVERPAGRRIFDLYWRMTAP